VRTAVCGYFEGAAVDRRSGVSLHRTILAFCFFYLGFVCLAQPSHAATAPVAELSDIDLTTVYVEIDDSDSNFTVVDARYDETATAAALFGLAGAAINSAANASQDEKRADTLRAAADEIDIAGIIRESLTSTLSGRGELDLKSNKIEAAHTIEVGVHNWGLLRVGRDDKRMRAFLNLSVRILDDKDRVVWEKKRENSVGQDARIFEDFTAENLKSDIETLAAKTGRYVGNQINYR
jgi:hypothetical protein